MNNQKILKGNKELILVISLLVGTMIVYSFVYVKANGTIYLMPSIVRILIGAAILYLVIVGKRWARTIILIYLVFNIVIGTLTVVGSFSNQWITNALLFIARTTIYTLCFIKFLKSENILEYIEFKNRMLQ